MYKNSKFRSRFLSSNSFCIKMSSAEFVTKNGLYNVHTYFINESNCEPIYEQIYNLLSIMPVKKLSSPKCKML